MSCVSPSMPKAIIAAICAAVLPASVLAQTVVQTDLGPVRGADAQGLSQFDGIPYAAPPVGPLRWQPAAPATPWTSPRDATAFGAICPQPASPGHGAAPQSEDCLTLNVVTPDAKAVKKLPVIVVMHGGAFFVGSGREVLERGVPSIVKRGVVLVSPNYRLGRLGFFAHPALKAEADAKGQGTANYWLTDQVAALQWVKRNIARFGGDPSNVTIMGCSAGGSSIAGLVGAPAAQGLFQKASVHSGGLLFSTTAAWPQAQQLGLAFAGRVGVKDDSAAGLAQLRGLSFQQVLAGDPGAPDFRAIVDGKDLPQTLAQLYAQGRMAHVPMIAGSTSNEASIFGLMGFDKAEIERRFGIDLDALRAPYGVNGPLSDAELLRQVQTDFIFTAGAMAMGSLVAKTGAPAWTYNFDYVDTARRGTVPGASHCADWPYLFDGSSFGAVKAPSAQDRALARQMQDYLYNFVTKGDPNAAGLPAWPRITPGSIDPLLIGTQVRAVPDFRRSQLQPWFAKWEKENGMALGMGTPAGGGQ
ncbi:carboxylesterase/lipase family protein [Novosphingobium rosa]|uniref:carboxylesterase/lipase family protein n=1 Tax=Novosphingobium rosa TaxID=76978 RepID=UPI000A8BAFE5|nr:carboxylesterase family protein [Novosphingobium rosa]